MKALAETPRLRGSTQVLHKARCSLGATMSDDYIPKNLRKGELAALLTIYISRIVY